MQILHFTANFEQFCHRLTTLSRPDERGIPFFLLRVVEAGYISKRLPAGRMEFSQHGGGCGRWIPHQVFRNAGQISVQAASLEGGKSCLPLHAHQWRLALSLPTTELQFML